jgi:hypothetical protein
MSSLTKTKWCPFGRCIAFLVILLLLLLLLIIIIIAIGCWLGCLPDIIVDSGTFLRRYADFLLLRRRCMLKAGGYSYDRL